jgi:hypothetical protein
LCDLNVWWMQHGIVHQGILPASPQENGTHERMHRELERETTQPPASNLRPDYQDIELTGRAAKEFAGAQPARGTVTTWCPSSRELSCRGTDSSRRTRTAFDDALGELEELDGLMALHGGVGFEELIERVAAVQLRPTALTFNAEARRPPPER